MQKIILVAHGSPKKDSNNLEDFSKSLSLKLNKNAEDVKYAYLQFNFPTLPEAIQKCIDEGATEIIIHPLFLFSGTHVNYQIPEIVKKFQSLYPQIKIICTKPLGLDEKLIDIIKEKLEEIK